MIERTWTDDQRREVVSHLREAGSIRIVRLGREVTIFADEDTFLTTTDAGFDRMMALGAQDVRELEALQAAIDRRFEQGR